MTNRLLIYGEIFAHFHIMKPFLTYDFATAPLRISLYMRKIYFIFYQCANQAKDKQKSKSVNHWEPSDTAFDGNVTELSEPGEAGAGGGQGAVVHSSCCCQRLLQPQQERYRLPCRWQARPPRLVHHGSMPRNCTKPPINQLVFLTFLQS